LNNEGKYIYLIESNRIIQKGLYKSLRRRGVNEIKRSKTEKVQIYEG